MRLTHEVALVSLWLEVGEVACWVRLTCAPRSLNDVDTLIVEFECCQMCFLRVCLADFSDENKMLLFVAIFAPIFVR